MKIKMIGIDHTNAPVEIREKFSFTKTAAETALNTLNSMEKVSGCVLISTCNRMELWATFQNEEPDLAGFLEKQKGVKKQEIEQLMISREGEAAVRHLFYLTGGLESLIVGDDQILTQLKAALSQSRDLDCTDSFIEVLFRMAITAGKKVRTEVNFDKGNRSAAALAVIYLQELGYEFENKKCLVIGNGEMGKLAATNLKNAGSSVTVTIRQYRSGLVCIPKDCDRINYGERYDFIPDCDYVFSATSSPNLTITKEELVKRKIKQNVVFVDLAVPRDIDSEIADMAGVKIYDIDSLKIDKQSEIMRRQQLKAKEILEKEINAFLAEQSGRLLLKKIQNGGQYFGEEVAWRMEKQLKKISCSDEERAQIYELIKLNSDKVMQKFLFALQKEVSSEEFEGCMEVLNNTLLK